MLIGGWAPDAPTTVPASAFASQTTGHVRAQILQEQYRSPTRYSLQLVRGVGAGYARRTMACVGPKLACIQGIFP